jgi:hypothetical protein
MNTTNTKLPHNLTRMAAPAGPWRVWTARDYVKATPPAALLAELDANGWHVQPEDRGQIVERAYSGRDGAPGWSPWMRASDSSGGGVAFYVRADLIDALASLTADPC